MPGFLNRLFATPLCAGILSQLALESCALLQSYESVIEAGRRQHNLRSNTRSQFQRRDLKPASWFNAFSEQESTYNDGVIGTAHRDTNPFVNVLDGWVPGLNAPAHLAQGAVPAELFHESPSAGWLQAWQTHWPQMQFATGQWYKGRAGSWNQEYVPFQGRGDKLTSDWFDSSVNQFDKFGRYKLPYAGSGQRLAYWAERSVNTTLQCADQGCGATATLQAFDGLTEQAMRCRFNLGVYPTDFDEDYSGEGVGNITINGVLVDNFCRPMASGCGQAQRYLYPCIQDLDITSIISSLGKLEISAEITDMVDECPYNGFLLNAIPAVTCMVRIQDLSGMDGPFGNGPPGFDNNGIGNGDGTGAGAGAGNGSGVAGDGAGGYPYPGAGSGVDPNLEPSSGLGPYVDGLLAPPTPAPSNGTIQDGALVDGLNPGQISQIINGGVTIRTLAPLSCIERGCESNIFVLFPDMPFSQCLLTVVVNQTDFDNSIESDEYITYIRINDRDLATNVVLPNGMNPCEEVLNGHFPTPEEMVAVVIQGVDITDDVNAPGHKIKLSGAITDYVEECESNGYLFNSLVQIDCSI